MTDPLAELDRPHPPPADTGRALERQCQTAIVDAARLFGYRVFSIRPATSARGRYASPIQGDAGYPDLTLVHPRAGVIYAELKRHPNRLEYEQREWGAAIIAAGGIYRLVWVPEEQDQFIRELRDRARQP